MKYELPHKQESYNIIGACMEVHKELGKGFSKIVYGDALEIEFKRFGISYKREVTFHISYKSKNLSHYYFADLVVDNKIILKVKAIECLTNNHIKQTLNYLAASKRKLGLLVNFGEDSLTYKRVIL